MKILPSETPGDRLKRALEAAGISQGELARRLGIQRPMISQLISGARVPSLEWLRMAAVAIGCDPAELAPELASRVVTAVTLIRSDEGPGTLIGMSEEDVATVESWGLPRVVPYRLLGRLVNAAVDAKRPLVIRADLPPLV